MTSITPDKPSRWVKWSNFGEPAQQIRDDRISRGEELIVTEDHRKLLAAVRFRLFPDGADYVYMGVEGKRPFGSSSNLADVAVILGWEFDEEIGLTDEQKFEAVTLMSELPDVLNMIIAEQSKEAQP